MGKLRRLAVSRFGPGATATLARLVAEAQRDDPLALVDVITPNAVSGMTLRRAIANPALARAAGFPRPRCGVAVAAVIADQAPKTRPQ